MCGRAAQERLIIAGRSAQFQRDAAAASPGLAFVHPTQGFAGGGGDASDGDRDGGGGGGGDRGGDDGSASGSGSSWDSEAGMGVGGRWNSGGGWSGGVHEAEDACDAHSADVESDGRPWRAGSEPCGWAKRRRRVKGLPRPRSLAVSERLGLGGLAASLCLSMGPGLPLSATQPGDTAW